MFNSEEMFLNPGNADFKSVREWIEIFEGEKGDIIEKLSDIYGNDQSFINERRAIFLGVLKSFADIYGIQRGVVITRSPCRINLRGMHSEMQYATPNYLTHGREMIIVASPRDDDLIVLNNLDRENFGIRQFKIPDEQNRKQDDWLKYIDSEEVRESIQAARGDWSNYVKAAVFKLQDSFPDRQFKGMDILAYGDVPRGSGMASSSALVVSSALATIAVNNITIDRRELTVCMGRGEWYVGTRGGFGDHGAMLFGKRGHILHSIFLNVEEMKPEYIPFPEDYQVIIINSYKSSSKSAERLFVYNQTMFAYSVSINLIKSVLDDMGYSRDFLEKLNYLGQITPETFGLQKIYEILRALPERISISELKKRYSDSEIDIKLDKFFGQLKKFPDSVEIRGAALWGIAESERSRAFARLIKEGRIKEAGQLMYIGHDGDRLFTFESCKNYDKPTQFSSNIVTDIYLDELIANLQSSNPDRAKIAQLEKQPGDFNASSLELDTIIEIVRNIPGIKGASLTGAGFGGNVLAIGEKNPELLNILRKEMADNYYEPQEQAELKWIMEDPNARLAFNDIGQLNEIRKKLKEIVGKKQNQKSSMDKTDAKYIESIQLLINKLFQQGRLEKQLSFIPADYYSEGITVNKSVERAGIL